MKVHRIVLLVVDSDNLGADEVRDVIESQNYPNHCIRPSVMSAETVEVEWTNEHPLNYRATKAAAFTALFQP